MKSSEKVKLRFPSAIAVAVPVPGQYVGGKTRYEIRIYDGSRKWIGCAMRESWAWADAWRAIKAGEALK
jgi:hypothetical protein